MTASAPCVLAITAALASACGRLGPPGGDGAPDAAPAARDRIFVSQAGSATVLAIDADSGAIEARIEVGLLPHHLAVSPDGRTLYAALAGSQAIAEIDTAGLRLRRTMLTAPVPAARPDGTPIQAHVDQDAFSHATCYDCHRPGGAEPRYAGDRPFGLLVSPDGGHLLVSHLRSAAITRLDLASGQIETTAALEPAGAAREAVAMARLGDELWVALRPPQPSTQAGVVRRLDLATLAPRGDAVTGADPAALLAMPERGSVVASNFESNTLTEYPSAGAPIAHAVAPGPLGTVALSDHEVLALDYYSNAISRVDLDAGTADTVRLDRGGAPYANPTQAAVASDRRSAWIVIGSTDGHLLQLDLQTLQVVRDLPIDGLSFGIALVSGLRN